MIPITNPKLAGLEPRWAPFRGVSLLFENPPDDEFFRALRAGVAKLERDPLIETHGLRLLPPAAYHVTVWDGVNDAKLPQVVPEFRAAWEQFLRTLPAASFPDALFREVLDSDLLATPDWNLLLRCDRIENWSDISLVARLAPADGAAAAALARVAAARDALSDAHASRFGVRPHPDYTPHVTLGYFANAGLAATSASAVARWNAVLTEKMDGRSLRLARIRLSVFADMASFGRKSG